MVSSFSKIDNTSTVVGGGGITLRLHLVRHGETIANVQQNAIGQSDSPLTSVGIQQAKALRTCHQSQWFPSSQNEDQKTYFWRIYSSDLQRTKHTTQLILTTCQNIGDNTVSSSAAYDAQDTIGLQLGVRYDCRLREIARGIRQGLPKHYTHEQAMKTYHSGIHPLYNIDNTMLQKQPLLESEDDGWNRMHTLWLMEIIHDVSSLHQNDSTNMKQCDHNHCHNVLVVTHGALLRVFLQRLFGHERLRERGDVTSKRNNNGNSSRLDIPNTSLTIIDIHINVHTSDVASVDVHCFANTEHYTLMNPKTHHVLDGN